VSKSLVKLIDFSLLPALILLVGKAVGILLTSRLFGTSLSIREYSSSLFSVTPVVPAEDLKFITTFSDLFMYIGIATFFSYVVIKAVFFHNTHVKPKLVTALANQNLLKLVQNTYEIYHMGAIALIFTWMANAIIIVNALSGRTFPWLAIASLISAVSITAILLLDVYKEIENIKHKPGSYQWI